MKDDLGFVNHLRRNSCECGEVVLKIERMYRIVGARPTPHTEECNKIKDCRADAGRYL